MSEPSSTPPNRARWCELTDMHLLGTISKDEAIELEAALASSREAREDYRQRCNVDSALRQEAVGQPMPNRVAAPKTVRWLTWRPLIAAAAGIVFGIFCTSMVFAYVAPALDKVTTLLQENFESGPAPMVTGPPVEAGHWSGDYTEVVGEQQGVKPESGKKMLRFLRTDYEGMPKPKGSKISDIFRLIDMRSYRSEFADGGAVVQLSAGFNSFEFPDGERYYCSLLIYALDTETATNGSMRGIIASNEALLGVQQRSLILDRDPATWQRLTSELRLPPATDFLMVRIFNVCAAKSVPRQTLAGHYVDGVRLTMARRPPLP